MPCTQAKQFFIKRNMLMRASLIEKATEDIESETRTEEVLSHILDKLR